MKHQGWLILLSILLIGTAGGLESSSVSAHAHHVSRVKRVRNVTHRRRHRSKHYRRFNVYRVQIPSTVYPKNLLYYTENGQTGFTNNYFNGRRYRTTMSKGYVNAVIKNEYQAINQARHSIHERPLIQSRPLTSLAKWRAKQANQRFTHYGQNGQPLAWLDAAKMRLGSYHYNRRNIGENMFFVGKLSQVHTDHGIAGYYFKDPSALAGDNVFDSLNNDAASQWSHGENIMMPQHRYVGIGTYYRRTNHGLYVLVEFSSRRPIIHRK